MKRTQTFTAFAAARGVTFTPAQSVAFRVAFDGVEPGSLEGDDRELARLLFGDVESVPALAREVACIVKGARIGGSRFSAMRALHLALTIDLSTLAPGEEAFVMLLSYEMRLSRQTMRFALGAVRADPKLRRMIDGEPSRDGFAIRRDGRRVVFTCLPATRGGSAVRARSIICAVLSEAAFFRDKNFAVNDAEIFRAVAPRVIPGGQTILESTPWMESGLLFELFSLNHGAPTTALAMHAPTLLMRPDARTLAIVEAERARDPDNASREFDALFIGSDASLFFDAVSLERAVDHTRGAAVLAPAGYSSGAGADLALISDSSALAVVARDADARLFELLQVEELRPTKGSPLKLSAVVSTFATVLRSHRIASMTADGHVREPAREWADEEKITIEAAPEGQRGKEATYIAFRVLLREGRFNMPHNARLLAQLRAVVARPKSGGGIIISSPRTRAGHGDLVSALVLAVHAATCADSFGGVSRGGFTTAASFDAQSLGDVEGYELGSADRMRLAEFAAAVAAGRAA